MRCVEVVEDLDATEPAGRFCSTASILDPLSAPSLSELRKRVRARYNDGKAFLLCAKCGKPVYVSVAGDRRPEQRDGRDAFFAHHAGTATDCEWGTTGENPRKIDCRKYGGAVEGELHRRLKAMLSAMLEADKAFSSVAIERVISRPPLWRKPDIVADFADGLVAFDLQLATTQLPTIVAREEFYEKHNIKYVWITSTDDAHNLARQSFQDIYWSNGAQIFGIDAEAEVITYKTNELHLWALAVAPRIDESGLHSVWEKRLVSRNSIDWGLASGRPRFQGADFAKAVRALVKNRFDQHRRRLIKAVGQSNEAAYSAAGHAWDNIAREVGAPSWERAEVDRVFKAIGVLSSVAAGKKMDASRYSSKALAAILNQFLEEQACRGWTIALQQIAAAYGNNHLLSVRSTKLKIDRNNKENHPDLQRRYAAMLDVMFPCSALARLNGPPREIQTVT